MWDPHHAHLIKDINQLEKVQPRPVGWISSDYNLRSYHPHPEDTETGPLQEKRGMSRPASLPLQDPQ